MRDGMYGFYDDAERFIFFSRAVLELLSEIAFFPDLIHCNDWQTAMIPVYYDIFYKYRQGYEKIKTIYTIHNIQYQGVYGKEIISELMGIPTYYTNLLDYDGCVNLMKGAIETADCVTTVSPTYAKEILDPWFSYGMDRELVCDLNLQADLKPINMNIVSMGALNEAQVHPREVMKSAILSNAACMMLLHNHRGKGMLTS